MSKDKFEHHRAHLQTVLRQVAGQTDDPLVRPELGEMNFGDAKPIIAEMRTMLVAVSAVDLGTLFGKPLSDLRSAADAFASHLQKIRDFRVSTQNAVELRAAILNELPGVYHQVVTAVSPVLAIGRGSRLDGIETELHGRHAALEAESKRLLAEMQRSFESASNQVQALEEMVAAGRKALAKTGVSEEARHFKSEADANPCPSHPGRPRSFAGL